MARALPGERHGVAGPRPVAGRPHEHELEIVLGLDEPDDDAALRARTARLLGTSPDALPALRLLKRSLDARRGRVRFHLLLEVGGTPPPPLALPEPREARGARRALIVGDGPAGLFCAYELARAGVASLVLDRGKPVQPRRRDLRGLQQEGRVDRDSNYCFGEGGAGTYSDGKLYTRSHKRGDVRDVLEILVRHGASDAILSDARPHIGSNKLPRVVAALRAHLEEVGVAFAFESRVVALSRDASGRVRGVLLADGREIGGDAVVLATGHSARDVLEMLDDAGVRLEPKGFALGVRIEHRQTLIDRLQYGQAAGHPRLPSASYRLAHNQDGRGVFTFCMCPGGFVVPAATEPDGIVVNGMSLSRRDSRFANSGLVVAIEPEDVARAGFSGPLGGVLLQRRIERAAKLAGGEGLRAPATRADDFLAGRASSSVPESSYQPGLTPGDVGAVLDAAGLPIAARLRAALSRFGRSLPGYADGDAVLLGVESRTSAPVRVPRDPDSYQSPDVAGLYPCGEGAGYAGGIVSAALDGMRVARALCAALGVAS
jgi:uncharacterized FAD-dependent dehydrogenase